MDPPMDGDIIYCTGTIRGYLKKFHGVEISNKELNGKLTEVILEEIEEEEKKNDTATGGPCPDIGGYS
jgi:hypothetical protein